MNQSREVIFSSPIGGSPVQASVPVSEMFLNAEYEYEKRQSHLCFSTEISSQAEVYRIPI